MGRKERWLYLALIIVAGMIGGGISSLFLQSGAAFGATHHHAEKKSMAAQSITAHEFVLLDSSGAKRAELHMLADGGPALDLYDSTGVLRASYAITGKDVSRVRFYNSKGSAQAGLGVTSDGRPALALMDTNRNLRATIDVSPQGAPTVRLYSAKGAVLGLDVTPDGRPGLALLDDGKTVGAFVVNEEGKSSLTLYDASGNVIAGLP
jgi:hypothetical protein